MRRTRLVALCAALLMAGGAAAQGYPSKPVRIIVTNPPGGTVDVLARTVADELSKSLGQPFVVENRPGANGNVGAEALAKAPADGYTLLVCPPGPLAINAAMFTTMPFDPKTAFAPVSLLAVAPLVLVITPSLPANTLAEFIAYAKANPGRMSYASQGPGSTGQLAMELLKTMAGIDLVHVPYKGSAPAMTDLIAGQVQAAFDNTTTSLPHVRKGSLRALAVAEKKRLEAAPEIPTVDEAGVKGFEATPWFGLVTRAGTPPEIVAKLSEETNKALAKPEVRARFATLGVELRGTTPEAFAAYIDAETQKWGRIVKLSGAKAE